MLELVCGSNFHFIKVVCSHARKVFIHVLHPRPLNYKGSAHIADCTTWSYYPVATHRPGPWIWPWRPQDHWTYAHTDTHRPSSLLEGDASPVVEVVSPNPPLAHCFIPLWSLEKSNCWEWTFGRHSQRSDKNTKRYQCDTITGYMYWIILLYFTAI